MFQLSGLYYQAWSLKHIANRSHQEPPSTLWHWRSFAQLEAPPMKNTDKTFSARLTPRSSFSAFSLSLSLSLSLFLSQGIGGGSDPPAYWPPIYYGAFGGTRKLFERRVVSLCCTELL